MRVALEHRAVAQRLPGPREAALVGRLVIAEGRQRAAVARRALRRLHRVQPRGQRHRLAFGLHIDGGLVAVQRQGQREAGNGDLGLALPSWGVQSYVAHDYVRALPIGPRGLHATLSAVVPAALAERPYMQDFAAILRARCAALPGVEPLGAEPPRPGRWRAKGTGVEPAARRRLPLVRARQFRCRHVAAGVS